jgi:dTDP-4-dehydrorhamnose 3,5-epimerase
MIEVIDLPLKDAKLIKLKRHYDDRGWFTETFKKEWLLQHNILDDFIFDCWSFNKNSGTIRGLHAQKTDSPQAKLVQVLNGSIQDVILDARQNSPTYGKHCEIFIESSDPMLIYVPVGFYHGYLTLSDNTYVGYKMSGYHNPDTECGVKFDCETLKINWQDQQHINISSRDKQHPTWDQAYKF